jgi:hypothetical protein
MSRATSKPARLFEATKMIALAIAIPSEGSRRRRLPYQSERWPARSNATTTPIA